MPSDLPLSPPHPHMRTFERTQRRWARRGTEAVEGCRREQRTNMPAHPPPSSTLLCPASPASFRQHDTRYCLHFCFALLAQTWSRTPPCEKPTSAQQRGLGACECGCAGATGSRGWTTDQWAAEGVWERGNLAGAHTLSRYHRARMHAAPAVQGAASGHVRPTAPTPHPPHIAFPHLTCRRPSASPSRRALRPCLPSPQQQQPVRRSRARTRRCSAGRVHPCSC